MDDGHCETAETVVSSVADLRPFETTAPYFIAILRAVRAKAPKILERKCAVDALLAIYCVDAIPFRDANRAVPVATDEHVMSVCLHSARALYYGRGGIPLMRKPAINPKRLRTIRQVNCWPKIENAFRELLGLRQGQRLTQEDLERRIFTEDPGDEAYALALAVTYMVIALQSGAR